jgi:uncharacterized membrane protein
MDNLISGVLAVALFLAFTLGLAQSIDKLPFAIIVVFVGGMVLVDLWQSAKEGLAEEKAKRKSK